jgi:hypothetical protein
LYSFIQITKIQIFFEIINIYKKLFATTALKKSPDNTPVIQCRDLGKEKILHQGGTG